MSRVRPVSDKRKRRVQLRWNSTIAVGTPPKRSRPKSPRKVKPTKLKSSKPKPRRPRKPSETLRAFGPTERRAWIKSLPSVASGKGPCVQAHTRTGGIARRADACWIVPLTDAEHREQHRIGKLSFEKKYGIDLDACAIATEAAWRARQRNEALPW